MQYAHLPAFGKPLVQRLDNFPRTNLPDNPQAQFYLHQKPEVGIAAQRLVQSFSTDAPIRSHRLFQDVRDEVTGVTKSLSLESDRTMQKYHLGSS